MKIGIAFAGGGVRGAAHLGILQALEEQGIHADIYAGTSAGSIVATMKALGHSNATCLKIIEEASNDLIDIAYWDIIKSMPSKFKTLNGVLKGEKLQRFLSEHIGDSLLMNVKHGLSVISTDVNTGAQIIFTSENLGKPKLRKIDDHVTSYGRYTPLPLSHIVYASCALPGIFRPLKYNNMTLVDGSMTNNLPANVVKAMGADKVIAIDLAKRNPAKNQMEGIFDILSQSVNVLIGQNMFMSTTQAKDVIRLSPDLTDIGILDFNRAQECYDAGYKYGKRIALIVKTTLESN
jgi:NTE family protein